MKALIVIFVIFLMIGYFIGNSDVDKKKANKKKPKKIKVK
jgi:hypothetical protein